MKINFIVRHYWLSITAAAVVAYVFREMPYNNIIILSIFILSWRSFMNARACVMPLDFVTRTHAPNTLPHRIYDVTNNLLRK